MTRPQTRQPFRIGQIVPSSNTTMETEIPEILGRHRRHREGGFTFHSSRMRMHRVTPEELMAMNKEGLRCAAELSDARVDVMSTACLVAIMAQGAGHHREVERDLAAVVAANGARSKVMTSAGALVYGLQKLGAKRVALLAPYMMPLTAKVVAYLEAEGIAVHDHRSFEIPDNLEVGRIDPRRLIDEVKALDLTGVDTVVLSACVQMPSLAALDIVEQALGLPVTSTAACTARQMLDLLDLEPHVPGCGAVLSPRGVV
jgi:maleate isomerase